MFQTLLANIARALNGAGIPYMVIGGQAVLLYGEPRLTRDINITLGIDAGELERVIAVGKRMGLTPATHDVTGFVRKTNVLPLVEDTTSIRVDLIFSFTPYEAQAIRRATTVLLLDVPVRFTTAEDLIVHKLVAGRPRDIEDVRGILGRQGKLDEGYLKTWLPTFREVLERDIQADFESLKRNLKR